MIAPTNRESLREVISENFKKIRRNVESAAKRCGRNFDEIQIVAATKKVGPEVIDAAIGCGAKIIGENRVQEAKEKFERVEGKAEWHFIGHLQKNKVKYLLNFFSLVHSVDSLELAREINRRAGMAGEKIRILLQVNIGEEASKFGVTPPLAAQTAKAIGLLPNVKLQGLMAIPPRMENAEESRPWFKKMATLREKIRELNLENVSMESLSMGMSGDYEVAVEEGATHIRIGRALFGERDA